GKGSETRKRPFALFHQWAFALRERPERLVRRDRRAHLVVVPRAFRFAGLLTSTRYAGWILRPSARIVPLPNSGSSVGVSFILAMTLAPSSLLSASTALR